MSATLKDNEPHRKPGKRKRPYVTVALFLVFVLTVVLYLTRLEAHTRADLFLPVNYHATLERNHSGEDISGLSKADALLLYYENYAKQENRPYTIRQDLLLSRLAYLNAPPGFRGETGGVTLRDLCREMTRMAEDPTVDAARTLGRGRQEVLEITGGIEAHDILGDLVLRDFFTHPSGLVGYTLEKDGEITLALRGTDDLIDTVDNFLLLPFNLSVQYADMRALLRRYESAGRIWLTGHSKGGHNAIYAASIDTRCRATGFNAPGFGIFLSDAQHDGLDFGVNYVINGDVTGFLLFHLERRIVLESIGQAPANRHRLDNFFLLDDLTIATRIQPVSMASEWITQILWLLLVFLAVYGLLKWFRRIMGSLYAKGRRAAGSSKAK